MPPETPKTYWLAQQASMLRRIPELKEGVDYIVEPSWFAYHLLKNTEQEAVDLLGSK